MQRGGGVAGQRRHRHPHWHSLHHLLCALPGFWIPAQVSTPFHLLSPEQLRESILIFRCLWSLFCSKGSQGSWSVPRNGAGHDGGKDRGKHLRVEPPLQVQWRWFEIAIHLIPHSSLRLFRMIPSQSWFGSSLYVPFQCSGGVSITVSGDHRALFKFTGPRHWLTLVHNKHSPLPTPPPPNTVPNPLSQIIGCYRLLAPPSFFPTFPTLDPNNNQSFLPDHVIDSSTSSGESFYHLVFSELLR